MIGVWRGIALYFCRYENIIKVEGKTNCELAPPKKFSLPPSPFPPTLNLPTGNGHACTAFFCQSKALRHSKLKIKFHFKRNTKPSLL